jgi:hypothetical protein
MSDNDKTSEVLIPIPVDRREACDRRRFIAGASAALAPQVLSSRQAAAQNIQKVTEAQHGQSASLQDQKTNSYVRPAQIASCRLRPIMAKSNRSGILSPSNIGAFNRVAGPGK